MTKLMIAVLAGAVALSAAACTNSEETTAKPASSSAAPPAEIKPPTNAEQPKHVVDDKVPAAVRAAFPDAESITTQHKDIPAGQIPAIEKDAGGKIPDTDHHSYFAFATTGGARKQIGAATIVKADNKEIVVVYESREGSPSIKEVRAEGIAPAFLDQFKGKGHDDKFQVGGDLKAQGVDEKLAKAIAAATRMDMLTMQALYGAAHKH